MVDWAELLPELLTSIAKRIHIYEDFVAFGGVCRSWRSAAVKRNFNHSASSRIQIPWLMLPEEDEDEEEEENNLRSFASLTKRGIVHKLVLPEARGKRCIGSLGWLITINCEGGGHMELLHPLTRVRIPLPHPDSYRYYEEGERSYNLFIHRAVLSASPSLTQDYVLMIILGSSYYPAFWRPGNTIWTVIEPPHPCHSLDVIYFKDQFYAIDSLGKLILCEVDGPDAGNGRLVGGISSDDAASIEQPYLVESGGDLLVVNRMYHRRDAYYWSSSFRLFKFDSENLNKCREIDDLGGVSVFMGHSAATSITPSGVGGIRPNCLYISDDYSGAHPNSFSGLGGRDTGIYSVETGAFVPLPEVNVPLSRFLPPIWVPPSF